MIYLKNFFPTPCSDFSFFLNHRQPEYDTLLVRNESGLSYHEEFNVQFQDSSVALASAQMWVSDGQVHQDIRFFKGFKSNQLWQSGTCQCRIMINVTVTDTHDNPSDAILVILKEIQRNTPSNILLRMVVISIPTPYPCSGSKPVTLFFARSQPSDPSSSRIQVIA